MRDGECGPADGDILVRPQVRARDHDKHAKEIDPERGLCGIDDSRGCN